MRSRPSSAWLWVGVAIVCLAGACAADSADEIVLMTHDSFVVSDSVLEEFADQTGVPVRLLPAGDAGAMVNQAILTRDNPIADVIFGIDNTFLSRAIDAGLFEPYASPLLSSVPGELQLDPENRVTPIDFGDVCVNFDRAAFTDAGVRIPVTLRDLADPTYAGRLVVENPATSSPGLAFLLATIAEFGETGDYTWTDYWADLVDNDVLVVSGWEEAYGSEFSGSSGEGDRPLVVSYASSPPAEVIFASEPPLIAPTGVLPDTCFRQIEFAGIVAGTDAADTARALIDFMLSRTFQEDIPLNMFVFPANAEAALPPEFTEYTVVPDQALSIDPGIIDANRERWIAQWSEIVR